MNVMFHSGPFVGGESVISSSTFALPTKRARRPASQGSSGINAEYGESLNLKASLYMSNVCTNPACYRPSAGSFCPECGSKTLPAGACSLCGQIGEGNFCDKDGQKRLRVYRNWSRIFFDFM
eukprot:TRINITY_DN965_c0_g1_i5.p2 TRINITY_DN965_c0_g1~~TRINITY_DN965_c0_g1_i5.p2  ORF type:complete len:122 (+),score=19.55 TRINITY_DN965_c0_g1_i5:321-686(+)